MLTHMQVVFLNVPYAQMKVTLVLEYIDRNEVNLNTNACLFSVNDEQKVYYISKLPDCVQNKQQRISGMLPS